MSQMIDVKTSELSGPALRWAVAQAERLEVTIHPPAYGNGHRITVKGRPEAYRPDMDWGQGGPLIENYKLDIGAPMESKQGPWNANTEWGNPLGCKGETPLIAACRAIVAAKLGDTVTVPAELLP
jgi:hypothetical protein